jgi:hypothetical protein
MAAEAGGAVRRWTLGTLGLAFAARLLTGPLPLNYYDVGYALVWGREIIHGHLPNYQTPGASTPHPLGTLIATLAALFGTPGGWYVVEAVIFLGLGLAGTALFRLTRTSVRRLTGDGARPTWLADAAGAVAVGALLLSPPFLTDALGSSGLSDLPALALVLAAAALIAERPDRWPGPLVLLGLAGLMRPEAWGLAGAYWLYLAHRRPTWRELLQSLTVVIAAPFLWALSDTIVAGHPAYSLTHTQAAAQTGIFPHGLGQVPGALGHDLRALVGLPVLVVGAAGALAALALARRAAAPALAVLALALGEFAALGVAGVPLLERFLLLAAAMTALFFALAVLAGPALVGDRRRLGLALTLVAAVLLVSVAGAHLRGDVDIRSDQAAAVHAEADLVVLAGRPAVATAVRRCTFYVPRFTLTSLVAVDFDLPPQAILRTTSRAPARGLILVPGDAAAGRYFGVTPARLRVLRRIATAATPVAGNRSWRLYATGCAS